MESDSRSAAALAEAQAAFARSDWEAARVGFERALEGGPIPEALDGLGQALLWLGDEEGAITTRAKAFAEYQRRGDDEAAANVAIYLAAEYRIAGNASLANGWLGRGQRLLEGCGDSPAQGWLQFELAKRSRTAEEAEGHARRAVEVARRIGDAGLEAAALSHAGLARLSKGDVDGGLALLDEAMTLATGVEAEDPLSIADACCTTLVACERLADARRARDWGGAITEFMRRRNFLPLTPWCRSVYAGFLVSTGEWQKAESELQAALDEALLVGNPLRRIPPRIHLADLRVRQGRLEEAAVLLAGLEDRPAALGPVVAVHLARGEVDLAAEKVEQRLEAASGEPEVLVAPLELLRARVELARLRLQAAREAIASAVELAASFQRDDLLATADVLAARAARLSGERARATALESAIERFAELGMPLDEAETRVELAHLLAPHRRALAIEQARTALATFERLGATRHADQAAALLRELGAPGRPAPRSHGALTKREREVLALVREGLSNDEIAQRLVISGRTAEHHVRSILGKLGVRNRAEAAAYAAREGAEGRL
jgi:DNA-binding NarL/FixJ family response regulator